MAQFDSTRENLPGPDIVMIDRLKIFLNSMGGGAWSLLVGVLICLVNSNNEQNSVLLNSVCFSFEQTILLRGTVGV